MAEVPTVPIDARAILDSSERDEILALAERLAGFGVWDVDLATGALRGSAQFFHIMGVEPTAGALPAEAARELHGPDDVALLARGFTDSDGKPVDYFDTEYRRQRPDGQWRWIFGQRRVIRDATGRPVRYCGVDVDITDRKHTEAALRESEELFRRVFEQSPLGKVIAAPDLRFRAVNPALCQMLGHAESELVGRNLLELVHPADRGQCESMVHSLVDGSLPQVQVEHRFVHKSGRMFWVGLNIVAIRDVDGAVRGTLGIVENIDDRKRITQALEDSEQRLRELNQALERLATERTRQLASSRAQLQAFFDNSPDALTLQRALPDGRFIYVDINPACEAAIGLARDQVVGRSFEQVMGLSQTDAALRHFRDCLRTGEPQRYVARRMTAGRTRTIDVIVAPVPTPTDGDRLLITAARDITEREQLEAQLRQAQKLEAIGKLTGGVAHDFNNLLAVITGNAELAKRRPPSSVPKLMDNILRAAGRGVTLTRQLLSFSRRQAASPQVIDLRVELPRVAEMLGASLKGGIALRLNVAADTWPIEVDPSELEIALLNVAVNARDAMPDGGQFEIEAGNTIADGTERVVIALRDTGAGIPADVIGKVFDPFFTTKQPGEGTGLGLSQVYGFAQQSGGTVSIDSEPGHGTTVTLHLPRSLKPLPAAANRSAQATPPTSGRILLVEDNVQVATVMMQLLQAMGFDVELLDRASKAIGRLDVDGHFDLLLTDVLMPDGIDGLQLANQARERFPTLPIILVSGYNDIVTTAGANFPMLRKPVGYDELQRVISATLRSSAHLAATTAAL